MRVKFAQYGISHAHASGKAPVLMANPDVEFCGVFEPDVEVRKQRGTGEAYNGVHWYGSREEMLDDPAIGGTLVNRSAVGADRRPVGTPKEPRPVRRSRRRSRKRNPD